MKLAVIFYCMVFLVCCQNNRPASYEYSDSTTVRKRTQVNPRDSGGVSNNVHQDTATHSADTTKIDSAQRRQNKPDSIQ